MTPEESNHFIESVLKGNWPKWEFTEVQMEGWLKRLSIFDFDKAKQCIEDYAFRRSQQGLPPMGQLLDALERAKIPQDYSGSVPIHVYEIVKEGNTRGYRFSLSRRKDLPADAREMEERAEQDRKRLKQLFPDINWVVLQRLKQYYGQAHPEEETPLRVMTADDKVRVQLKLLDGPDRPGKKFMQWYLSDERKRDRKTGHITEAIEM